MKVAAAGFTFSACDALPELFAAMFPGAISEKMSMSKSQVSCMLSVGLWPFFRTNLCKRIIEIMFGHAPEEDVAEELLNRLEA